MANLLDLPNELLTDILDTKELDSASLYATACVCHRLHAISLPLFLAQNGADSELRSIRTFLPKQRDTPDLLSGLRISFSDLSSIEEIACTFPEITTPFPPAWQTLRVARILDLVRGSLQKLAIYQRGPRWAENGDRVAHPAVHEDAAHFARLLQGAVNNSQCRSVCVSGGPLWRDAYEGLLPGVTRPNQPSLDVAPKWCSTSSLTSFDFRSSALLVPPVLDTTLALLRHSCVSTLILSMDIALPGMYLKIIPALVPSLDNITTLVLTQRTDHAAEQVYPALLNALPQLLDLTVECNQISQPRILAQVPPIYLPHLKRLRADAIRGKRFLEHSDAFPSLETLVITYPANSFYFEAEQLISLLGEVFALPAVHGPSITLVIIDQPDVWKEEEAQMYPRQGYELVSRLVLEEADCATYNQVRNLQLLLGMFPSVQVVEVYSIVPEHFVEEHRQSVVLLRKRLAEGGLRSDALRKISVNGEVVWTS